jgi:anti-sigma factor ChrR (cupin superfamily)
VTHVRLSDAEQERLALYALSALDREEAAALEAHLAEGCTTCRTELASFRAVTAELPLAVAPCPPSSAVRERVLGEAERPRPQLPPLHFLMRDGGAWEEIGPGVERRVLAGDAYLIRMASGARVATHEHGHIEHCYVVEGDLVIAGRRLRIGDYHRAAAGTVHDGIRSDAGALLLIVEAAV